MEGGRIRYPEIDSSSEFGSISPKAAIVDDYLFVAVGKELKDNQSTVIWAIHNSGGKKLGILHVHTPSNLTHHETERQQMLKALDEYVQLCASAGVTAQTLVVEADSIENGIIRLIAENMIAKLVIGAAADNRYKKRGMKEIMSEKAKFVKQHAPGHCQIQFVCNNVLIATRKATAPLVDRAGLAPSPSDVSQSSTPSSPQISFAGGSEKLWEKIETLEIEKAEISMELQEAQYKYFVLDSKVAKSDLKAKRLEQDLASTIELLESYKKAMNEMHRESDNNAIKFCLDFPSQEIQSTTVKIGEDAYGVINKGFLRRTEVAVKVPHPGIPQEFRKEVEIMCKLRHPNIVNLIGICTELQALIYEHCAKGTLEDRLNNKDQIQGSPFPWKIRLKIATELCNVLAFLHSHKPNPVIHGDLRPENIHLDSNYTCKLISFRISDTEVRSYPYMDPEFFRGGDLTTRSDVYALGVILLRLLTGKPAIRLARQVQIAFENDGLSDLLDTSAGWPLEQANQLADLALRCCEMSQDRRPDLDDDVWNVLESMDCTTST